jgi:hypothetical protein
MITGTIRNWGAGTKAIEHKQYNSQKDCDEAKEKANRGKNPRDEIGSGGKLFLDCLTENAAQRQYGGGSRKTTTKNTNTAVNTGTKTSVKVGGKYVERTVWNVDGTQCIKNIIKNKQGDSKVKYVPCNKRNNG